jgi:hypothetical protein
MDFSETIIEYYQGERNEAVYLFIFGLILLVISIIIWFNLNLNEMLKGLFFPILLLTILSLFAGGYNVWNNQKRINIFPIEYIQDSEVFLKTEIQRFTAPNGVNSWWLPLKVFWTVLLILGLSITNLTKSDFIQGIAIGLIVWGCFGIIVDGFAHQRAKKYTFEVLKQ